ncbi:MAG: hypothetical protein ACRC62_33500 [Microcoleus sp.]
MYKQITLLVLLTSFLDWHPVLAFGRKVVDCNSVKNGLTVSVPQGLGVDIKLSCGGDLADVRLSDESRFIVGKRGPQHLYIRRIAPLSIPGLLPSSDGSVMLTSVTTDGSVYQFRLVSGNAGYTFLDVGAVSQPSFKPIPPKPRLTALLPVETPAPTSSPFSIDLRNDSSLVPPVVIDLRSRPSVAPIVTTNRNSETSIPKISSATNSLPVSVASSTESIKPEKPKKTKKIKLKKEKKSKLLKIEAPKIQPDNANKPLVTSSLVASESSPVIPHISKTTFSSSSSDLANSIVRGLAVANRTKEIGYKSTVSAKTQDLVINLRRGDSLDKAITKAGIDRKIVDRLLSLGDKNAKN